MTSISVKITQNNAHVNIFYDIIINLNMVQQCQDI